MTVTEVDLVISVSFPKVHASDIALSRLVDWPYRGSILSARRLLGQASMAVLRRDLLESIFKEYIFKDMFLITSL